MKLELPCKAGGMTHDGDLRREQAEMAAIAAGDRRAMRAFYETHVEAATRFAQRYLDDASAADAVHEAMLAVWRDAGRFDGRARARTWLHTIVRNKAVDALRRSGREPSGAEPDLIPGDATPTDDAVAAAQDADLLRAAMATLSPVQRAAIHLAYYEEMSLPEIAKVEGVPLGTVKTRIHGAKKLLAYALSK